MSKSRAPEQPEPMANSGRSSQKSAPKPLSSPRRKVVRRTRAALTPEPGPELFINREVSWLDFNSRVLELAANPKLPLLERVKFLAIFSSNLDEFYMVRVAGLLEQLRTQTRDQDPAGFTANDVLDIINKRVKELCAYQTRIWMEQLQPQLTEENIEIVPRSALDANEIRNLRKYFQKMVQPVLTPLAIDPAHPFPHLPNRSLCLCVRLRRRGRAAGRYRGTALLSPSQGPPDATGRDDLFAFVEVPQILPRFIPLPRRNGRTRFILLRDLIGLFLNLVFAGAEVLDSYVTRITRDSDLDLDEEEAEDLLQVVEKELRQRQWGNAVRVEISNRAPQDVVDFLIDSLQADQRSVIPIEGPVNYGDFFFLASLPGHDHLRYKPFVPHVRPEWTTGENIFSLIRQKDRLLHHPYESFSIVSDFIETAANDPDVLAIKMTLYRTSADSPIIRSLIKAATNGKQVVALVELKARFDEANNIQWARQLERGGCHVVYGIVGLKTHCKAVLVVRREGKSLRRYCHLGTGNYHPNTANLYTDVGLLTANEGIGEDIGDLFNMLTGYAEPAQWHSIVTSPDGIHRHLLEQIQVEITHRKRGRPAGIFCKMNNLVDPTMIRALIRASQAGVPIRLQIRGICCLRPGVPGFTDNIEVRSVVGRFLEHSRIFRFENGNDGPLIYISSGDWMPRNFFRRVEIMTPIEDPDIAQRLNREGLETSWNDESNSWELRSDGQWRHRHSSHGSIPLDSHQQLIQLEQDPQRSRPESEAPQPLHPPSRRRPPDQR